MKYSPNNNDLNPKVQVKYPNREYQNCICRSYFLAIKSVFFVRWFDVNSRLVGYIATIPIFTFTHCCKTRKTYSGMIKVPSTTLVARYHIPFCWISSQGGYSPDSFLFIGVVPDQRLLTIIRWTQPRFSFMGNPPAARIPNRLQTVGSFVNDGKLHAKWPRRLDILAITLLINYTCEFHYIEMKTAV